ncbi:hypothetical protein EYF80_005001 [Liparis tanakae]|uniref:Uncharacterized protein n=1 Tax=Liparis tanakae TaxID=230148 RepID=A0A4Z2J440_9TELE|nr:hypothetical protein EYF80_005001 [Liparis tanakae]
MSHIFIEEKPASRPRLLSITKKGILTRLGFPRLTQKSSSTILVLCEDGPSHLERGGGGPVQEAIKPSPVVTATAFLKTISSLLKPCTPHRKSPTRGKK